MRDKQICNLLHITEKACVFYVSDKRVLFFIEAYNCLGVLKAFTALHYVLLLICTLKEIALTVLLLHCIEIMLQR